jgi:ubiquinone/menaquinone biosynthesis C-methylase UbiE
LQKVDILCTATDIPESSSTYDVVICTQVIEHIFDHAQVFKEAYRLLKPGGLFIVSSNLIWELHEVPNDFYRFTRYGLEELLTRSGFSICEWRSNGGKFAVLGQLILHICSPIHNPASNWIKRKLYTIVRRCLLQFVNRLFPLLDDRYKDDSKFTINYIFIGKKE